MWNLASGGLKKIRIEGFNFPNYFQYLNKILKNKKKYFSHGIFVLGCSKINAGLKMGSIATMINYARVATLNIIIRQIFFSFHKCGKFLYFALYKEKWPRFIDKNNSERAAISHTWLDNCILGNLYSALLCQLGIDSCVHDLWFSALSHISKMMQIKRF